MNSDALLVLGCAALLVISLVMIFWSAVEPLDEGSVSDEDTDWFNLVLCREGFSSSKIV